MNVLNNRLSTIVLVLISSMVLSGCGIYSNYKARDFHQSSVVCSDTVDMLVDDTSRLITWRDMFTDTLLQSLIDSALHRNSDLRIAQFNIEKAEAGLMNARLSYYPSFAINAEAGLSSFNGSAAAKSYSLPLAAQWEVDLFGKLRNNKEQQISTLLKSQSYVQMIQCQLVASVANGYYTLVMLDEQSRIMDQSITVFEQSYQVIKDMKQAGMQTQSAVDQAYANLLGVKASQRELVRQIASVENSMTLLLNLPVSSHIKRIGYTAAEKYERVGEMQNFVARLDSGIPLHWLANRPDVRMSEYELRTSFYGVNLARSAFYPSLRLSGVAGWTNNLGAVVSNPAAVLLSAVASLTQPIFNAGVNKANLRVAKAQYEQSLVSFDKKLLEACVEVNEALIGCQITAQTALLRRDQVASSLSAYENSMELMKYTSMTYLEVLTAQNSLLRSQLDELGNWLEGMQSRVALYKSLGGGVS